MKLIIVVAITTIQAAWKSEEDLWDGFYTDAVPTTDFEI